MATILLVEGHGRSLETLARCLEARGHVVARARDGAEGVRMTAALLPQAVLIDASAAVLGVVSAVGWLKGCARTREIPVVVLGADAATGARCLAAGCDGCEPSPLAIHRLEERLRALLAMPRAGSTLLTGREAVG